MAINKSRGRPATGREYDGTLFLRLPSGRKEEVKKLVREFLGQAAPVGVEPRFLEGLGKEKDLHPKE